MLQTLDVRQPRLGPRTLQQREGERNTGKTWYEYYRLRVPADFHHRSQAYELMVIAIGSIACLQEQSRQAQCNRLR